MDRPRFPWRSLLVLILIAAAINIPIAHQFVTSTTSRPARNIINEIGPTAAAYPWPIAFPDAEPWPPPHQWSKEHQFGFTMIGAWGVAGGQTTHQMTYYLYGWPIASLDRRLILWPGAATASPRLDPFALNLRWRGVILNPILVGGLAWVAFVLTPWKLRRVQRNRRLRRNHCPRCNYDLSASPTTCPECGWNRPTLPTPKPNPPTLS